MEERVLHLDLLQVLQVVEDSLQAGLLGHPVGEGQLDLEPDPVPAPVKTLPQLLLQELV